MEALALIIGELVFAILAPFVAIVIEAVGAAISAGIALVTRRSTGKAASPAIARFVAIALAVLTGAVFACVLVVNFLYFEESVDYVLGKVEDRTGIVANCETIDGSLLTGRVELDTCSIRRTSHPSSTFEFDVAEVAINVRMTSLLGTATLDTARVSGLNGWVNSDRSQVSKGSDTGKADRPRRKFRVEDLSVADIRVELSGSNPDGNPFKIPVEIEQLESRPLRSRYALFDLLFRSNASGMLDGAPFRLSSSTIPDGRQTEWRAEKVPVASFGSMTGGLLGWFSSGYVDVYVDDEWQRGDGTDIDMDWRLRFSGLEVSPPPGTGGVTRFVTAPLTSFVNRFDGEFPLEFGLVLNENQFEYRSSLASSGVWSAVGEAANNALSLIGLNIGSPESTGESIKEGARSILDRVRKPKEQDKEESRSGQLAMPPD